MEYALTIVITQHGALRRRRWLDQLIKETSAPSRFDRDGHEHAYGAVRRHCISERIIVVLDRKLIAPWSVTSNTVGHSGFTKE